MMIKSKIASKYKELAWLGLSLLAFYVIVPQIKGFSGSWHLISSPKWSFVALTSLTIILTYLFSALVFLCLSKKPLKLMEEIVIQIAANFVNRLLPAGIGGIGANIQYLRHEGYSKTEAASIVATNNILGVVAHLSIFGLALLVVSTDKLPKVNFTNFQTYAVLGVVLVLAVICLVFYKKRQDQANKILSQMKTQLIFYRDYPWRLGLALLSHLMLTTMNVLAVYFAAAAVGIHIHIIPALVVFTFGSAVRNFTPTPGGIGGFEASLVAGFIAYNYGSSQALAAVLLYRLISYWIPLVISGFTFVYVTNKKMLEVR